MQRGFARAAAAAAILLIGGAGFARAQDEAAAADPLPSPHGGGLWERDALTGDWDGWRDTLENAGVLLGADSIDETLDNASGGVRRGAIYDGRLELLLTLDLDKLVS